MGASGRWDFTKPSDWIARGRTAVPRIVFSMSDETFIKNQRKELNPKFAAMLGRVKLEPMDFEIANKLLFLLG